jgi:ABC-type multidrug transport system fused ATPase/permease subunit
MPTQSITNNIMHICIYDIHRIINYLDMKTITRDVSKTPVFAALTSTNSNTVEKEHVPNASDDKVVNVSTSNQISDNSMQNRGNDMLNSFVDVSMSDSIYCSAGESTNCIDISSSTSASSQSKSMSAENSITYTSNQKTIVEFHNVSFYYNQRPDRLVLCHLNLKCHENSITAIIGESGSGKSTILSMMCGFYTPTVGDVFVANENTKNCNHKLTLSKVILLCDIFYYTVKLYLDWSCGAILRNLFWYY